MSESRKRRTDDRIFVDCSACDGRGVVAISRAYRLTLEALDGEWTPTKVLLARLGKGLAHTALNNRLVWLWKHRLVESRESESADYPRGREWRSI